MPPPCSDPNAPRRRARSRSVRLRGRVRAEGSASSGAGDTQPLAGQRADIETYLSPADIENLGDDEKEALRQIQATEPVQQKFSDFKWLAASGAMLQTRQQRKSTASIRAEIYEELPSMCDPIPEWHEIIKGIGHYSNNVSASGEKWPMLRAMHSRKMHYWNKLKNRLEKYSDRIPFAKSWPDTSPASGGINPLSKDNVEGLSREFGIKTSAEFVKHLLTLHDGEVRLVGESHWVSSPVDISVLRKACFWQYQFCHEVVTSNVDILTTMIVSTCFPEIFGITKGFDGAILFLAVKKILNIL